MDSLRFRRAVERRGRPFLGGLLAAVYFFVHVAGAGAAESRFWEERREAARRLTPEQNQLLAQLPGAFHLPLGVGQSFSPAGAATPSVAPATSDELRKAASKAGKSSAPDAPAWLTSLVLPHGAIRDIHLSSTPNAPLVIHIQDAHDIEDAQRHMAAMIESLTAERGVSLVGLEGAAGAFALEPFRAFPDADILRGVADYFLKEAYIGGPEYAGLTAAKAPLLWGVEDLKDYEQNIQSFKDSLKNKPAAHEYLSQLKTAADVLKQAAYSAELKEFDRHFNAYKNDQEPLGNYLKYLMDAHAGSKLGYTNVHLLLNALAWEKDMDFKKVEEERRRLVETLAKRLTEQQLNSLIQKSLLYRSGGVTYGDYYRFLRELCGQGGVDLDKFGQINSYITYVLLAEKINRDELLVELDRLEAAVPDRLARTTEQKRLVAANRHILLLEKLTNHAMTPADWLYYLEKKIDVLGAGLELKVVAMSMNQPKPPASPAGFPEMVKPFEDFCLYAVARNRALVENLLGKMKADGQKSAVLVAGGFHTDGLTRLLRNRDASYVVITPKIDELPKENKSLDVLARDPLPIEKLFKGETINLVTRRPIGLSSRDPRSDGIRVRALVLLDGFYRSLRGRPWRGMAAMARAFGQIRSVTLTPLRRAGASRAFIVTVDWLNGVRSRFQARFRLGRRLDRAEKAVETAVVDIGGKPATVEFDNAPRRPSLRLAAAASLGAAALLFMADLARAQVDVPADGGGSSWWRWLVAAGLFIFFIYQRLPPEELPAFQLFTHPGRLKEHLDWFGAAHPDAQGEFIDFGIGLFPDKAAAFPVSTIELAVANPRLRVIGVDRVIPSVAVQIGDFLFVKEPHGNRIASFDIRKAGQPGSIEPLSEDSRFRFRIEEAIRSATGQGKIVQTENGLVLFDPYRSHVESLGLSDRIEFISGDFKMLDPRSRSRVRYGRIFNVTLHYSPRQARRMLNHLAGFFEEGGVLSEGEFFDGRGNAFLNYEIRGGRLYLKELWIPASFTSMSSRRELIHFPLTGLRSKGEKSFREALFDAGQDIRRGLSSQGYRLLPPLLGRDGKELSLIGVDLTSGQGREMVRSEYRSKTSAGPADLRLTRVATEWTLAAWMGAGPVKRALTSTAFGRRVAGALIEGLGIFASPLDRAMDSFELDLMEERDPERVLERLKDLEDEIRQTLRPWPDRDEARMMARWALYKYINPVLRQGRGMYAAFSSAGWEGGGRAFGLYSAQGIIEDDSIEGMHSGPVFQEEGWTPDEDPLLSVMSLDTPVQDTLDYVFMGRIPTVALSVALAYAAALPDPVAASALPSLLWVLAVRRSLLSDLEAHDNIEREQWTIRGRGLLLVLLASAGAALWVTQPDQWGWVAGGLAGLSAGVVVQVVWNSAVPKKYRLTRGPWRWFGGASPLDSLVTQFKEAVGRESATETDIKEALAAFQREAAGLVSRGRVRRWQVERALFQDINPWLLHVGSRSGYLIYSAFDPARNKNPRDAQFAFVLFRVEEESSVGGIPAYGVHRISADGEAPESWCGQDFIVYNRDWIEEQERRTRAFLDAAGAPPVEESARAVALLYRAAFADMAGENDEWRRRGLWTLVVTAREAERYRRRNQLWPRPEEAFDIADIDVHPVPEGRFDLERDRLVPLAGLSEAGDPFLQAAWLLERAANDAQRGLLRELAGERDFESAAHHWRLLAGRALEGGEGRTQARNDITDKAGQLFGADARRWTRDHESRLSLLRRQRGQATLQFLATVPLTLWRGAAALWDQLRGRADAPAADQEASSGSVRDLEQAMDDMFPLMQQPLSGILRDLRPGAVQSRVVRRPVAGKPWQVLRLFRGEGVHQAILDAVASEELSPPAGFGANLNPNQVREALNDLRRAETEHLGLSRAEPSQLTLASYFFGIRLGWLARVGARTAAGSRAFLGQVAAFIEECLNSQGRGARLNVADLAARVVRGVVLGAGLVEKGKIVRVAALLEEAVDPRRPVLVHVPQSGTLAEQTPAAAVLAALINTGVKRLFVVSDLSKAEIESLVKQKTGGAWSESYEIIRISEYAKQDPASGDLFFSADAVMDKFFEKLGEPDAVMKGLKPRLVTPRGAYWKSDLYRHFLEIFQIAGVFLIKVSVDIDDLRKEAARFATNA